MKQIAVRRDQVAQANRARRDGNNIQATPVLGQGQILMRYQRLHVAQVLYRFTGRQTSTPLDDRRPDFVAVIVMPEPEIKTVSAQPVAAGRPGQPSG